MPQLKGRKLRKEYLTTSEREEKKNHNGFLPDTRYTRQENGTSGKETTKPHKRPRQVIKEQAAEDAKQTSRQRLREGRGGRRRRKSKTRRVRQKMQRTREHQTNA